MLRENQMDSDQQNEHTFKILQRLGLCLDIPIERSFIEFPESIERLQEMADAGEEISPETVAAATLQHASNQVGFQLVETSLSASEVYQLVTEGFPVVLVGANGESWVFESLRGRKLECCCISDGVEMQYISFGRLKQILAESPTYRMLVTQAELLGGPNQSLAAHGGHHNSPGPLRRFLSILRLDTRDVFTLLVFALVGGGLSLSTPLAVEALVNVVSWGTAIQPLLILSGLLFGALGFGAVLTVLQNIVAEIIQRRQFTRIVGDLAHRFPRASRLELQAEYPRELANRFFDVMTIQKATAVLLLDGIGIILQVTISLVLLAFYHPFLLGFDIVLISAMFGITLLLGRGGVRTSIKESKVKYKVAHWLQDVIASPAAFKLHGGESLAVDRANRLTVDYLQARDKHFRVLLRQITFAAFLLAIALTSLLGLGGWLVIKGQLTLGQLIASELVVTVVMGAFAKAGKSIETFYDAMAAVDKVGHMLDLVPEERESLGKLPEGPLSIRWENLGFDQSRDALPSSVEKCEIKPGECVAIAGGSRSGGTQLLETLAGLHRPQRGIAEVGGLSPQVAAFEGAGRLIGYAGETQIFHGSLIENIELGRTNVSQTQVRSVLSQLGMWDTVLRLPHGMETELQTGGHPLSSCQKAQLTIARAMVAEPGLLLIDRILDDLTPKDREKIWKALARPDRPWTLVIATNHDEIIAACDRKIDLKEA